VLSYNKEEREIERRRRWRGRYVNY